MVGTATPSGAADYYELDNVQLELGGQATAFKLLPFDVQLDRAQLWVQKSFPYATPPVTNVGSSAGAYKFLAGRAGALAEQGSSQSYAPSVRGGATVVAALFNPLAANQNVRDVSAAADCSAAGFSSGEQSFAINCVGNAATAVGNLLAVHYVTDAGI